MTPARITQTIGQVLWETMLPFSVNATPAAYSVGGRKERGGIGRVSQPLPLCDLPGNHGHHEFFPEDGESGCEFADFRFVFRVEDAADDGFGYSEAFGEFDVGDSGFLDCLIDSKLTGNPKGYGN